MDDPVTVTQAVYGDSDVYMLLSDMQYDQQVQFYWLLGALMLIAGALFVISFFVARGDSH